MLVRQTFVRQSDSHIEEKLFLIKTIAPSHSRSVALIKAWDNIKQKGGMGNER